MNDQKNGQNAFGFSDFDIDRLRPERLSVCLVVDFLVSG